MNALARIVKRLLGRRTEFATSDVTIEAEEVADLSPPIEYGPVPPNRAVPLLRERLDRVTAFFDARPAKLAQYWVMLIAKRDLHDPDHIEIPLGPPKMILRDTSEMTATIILPARLSREAIYVLGIVIVGDDGLRVGGGDDGIKRFNGCVPLMRVGDMLHAQYVLSASEDSH